MSFFSIFNIWYGFSAECREIENIFSFTKSFNDYKYEMV